MSEEAVTGAIAPAGEAMPEKRKRGRPKKIARPAMREPMRDLDAEPGPSRNRIRQTDVGGRFEIPPEMMSRLPDSTVEWKRHKVLGQEDPYYEMELRRKGWEPVQSYMMPGMMPKGMKGAIERDGMMLWERPKELTDQARAEDRREAVERILAKEQQLNSSSPGEFTRDDPGLKNRISHSYEPFAIPRK